MDVQGLILYLGESELKVNSEIRMFTEKEPEEVNEWMLCFWNNISANYTAQSNPSNTNSQISIYLFNSETILKLP